ncbi:hypothetical protein [Streptomyces poriticola]|uniref:hypothetical protein n=1 Tax=Streptomyces poriticola TaxID=3120506 RepID=UPI002FCE0407
MTTWALVVETTVGFRDRKHVEANVVAHVEGSRAEALTELERRARSYQPEHPWSPDRRRLLRTGDGFLLVVDGAMQSFATRFTAAELLHDSAAPKPAADPPAEPARPSKAAGKQERRQEDERAEVERDADGVPVRPAWLGRPDLM